MSADVVPVEKALLARADPAASHARSAAALDAARRNARIHGLPAEPWAGVIAATVAEVVAAELRALAEELHYQ